MDGRGHRDVAPFFLLFVFMHDKFCASLRSLRFKNFSKRKGRRDNRRVPPGSLLL
jgi:hypothetical protein